MPYEHRTQTIEWATRDTASRAPRARHDAASRAMERCGRLFGHMDRYTRHPRASAQVGFTLIELLIVLVILGIAAAIAVPMMSSAASMQLRAAGGMVAADLEYAKSMAISRGQRYSVVFNAANETYEIRDPNNAVIEHPVRKGHDYAVDFANDGRLNRIDIVSANFDGNSTVRFDYLGSPFNQAGGDLNSGTITLQAGDSTRTVTVEPVTGFIAVSD
jgi:type II secretion system protein H